MKKLSSTPRIVAFYPCPSLADQMKAWSELRGGREIEFSYERSLAGIRRQIENVDFVLVDATGDPAQASDAYLQIYKILGPDAMSVYTNIVHDGLEILVRRLGVTLLLGPMSISEWDGFFLHKFPRTIPLSSAQTAAQSPPANPETKEAIPVNKPFPFKSIAG